MLKNSKKRKQGGFTLIELVVTIAILAVLATILMPKVIGIKDQAKIAADRTSIETINRCIALHTVSNNYENLVGQTSINVFSPIKNGDSVTVILKFLQDKELLSNTAKIYFPQGHNYSSADNEVK